MSDHVVSGREDRETTQTRLDQKVAAVGSLALLVVALAIGFLAGLKACPRCPRN